MKNINRKNVDSLWKINDLLHTIKNEVWLLYDQEADDATLCHYDSVRRLVNLAELATGDAASALEDLRLRLKNRKAKV